MSLKDKYIGLLIQILAIPAVSRMEETRADFLENWLKGEGLFVKRINNNLIVANDDDLSGKEILLNSHIDTVPPGEGWDSDPYLPVRGKDRIIALGSNDAGASVVGLIASYIETNHRDKLVLAITAEEEISGKDGLAAVLPLLNEIKFGIVGEPTGMQPAVAERGLMVVDAVSEGINGHAARNEGENAIYKALDDISKIRKLKFTEKSEWLDEPSVKVTMINSGTKHNVIPAKCEYVIDVRSNDIYTNSRILGLLQELCQSNMEARSLRLKSSSLDLSHPVHFVLKNLNMKSFGSPTLSDMAQMAFPTVKIGPGDSARSHGPNEYILFEELESAIGTYKRLIEGLCKLPL